MSCRSRVRAVVSPFMWVYLNNEGEGGLLTAILFAVGDGQISQRKVRQPKKSGPEHSDRLLLSCCAFRSSVIHPLQTSFCNRTPFLAISRNRKPYLS